MKIIPVIDLMSGRVMHARGGRRDEYRPLETALADSSEPGAVIAGLRSFYRFDTVYVADIDAIEGRDDQGAIIQSLVRGFPDCRFWLDAGPVTLAVSRAVAEPARLHPVCGSENHDCGALEAVIRKNSNILLSLDFRNELLIGDPELLIHTWLWPREVIVMSLDRVGSHRGPDIERIRQLREQAPAQLYYAAGGVRNDRDLERLAEAEISGALIATALHQQALQTHRL